MTAVNLPKQVAIILLALALCSSVAAQPVSDSQPFVGVKAGMNYEQAEDGLSGAAAAGGLVGGITLRLSGRLSSSSGYARPFAIRRPTRRIATFSSASAPSVCSARKVSVRIFSPVSASPARRTHSRLVWQTDRLPHHRVQAFQLSLIALSPTFGNTGASRLMAAQLMWSVGWASKCHSGAGFTLFPKFVSMWHSCP